MILEPASTSVRLSLSDSGPNLMAMLNFLEILFYVHLYVNFPSKVMDIGRFKLKYTAILITHKYIIYCPIYNPYIYYIHTYI